MPTMGIVIRTIFNNKEARFSNKKKGIYYERNKTGKKIC